MTEKITISMNSDKIIIHKKSNNNARVYFPMNRNDEKKLESLPLSIRDKVIKLSLVDDIIYLSIDEKETIIWIVSGGSKEKSLGEYLNIFDIDIDNTEIIFDS